MTKKLTSFEKIVLLVAPLAFVSAHPSHAANQPLVHNHKVQQEETAKVLEKLVQSLVDESFLFNQCIDSVKNHALKDKLLSIKNDCEKNIRDLSDLGKKFEMKPVEYSKDFKGYFMNGYTAMRGAFTDQGTLKALHTNLKLILNSFESALNSSLSIEVKEVIQKIYDNKKKALQDIESQI